jgi:hypothetical protein
MINGLNKEDTPQTKIKKQKPKTNKQTNNCPQNTTHHFIPRKMYHIFIVINIHNTIQQEQVVENGFNSDPVY